jgi:thiamine monophosphate kinase
LALNGGEDYELLFTSQSKILPSDILGVKVTQIGIIESRPCTQRRDKQGRWVFLVKDNKEIPLQPKGYDHFT